MANTDFFTSLKCLFGKGVRYSTVIDVGCADGHFVLNLLSLNLIPGATPVNIDANSLYESSLKAIAEVVGGHYRISAITDHEGSIEITTAAHPYWASIRPEDDLYWQRLNRLSGTKVTVPATTLDILSKQLDLKPPFLLKLDVQGAEEKALIGGSEILKGTHVVICEADVDDFQTINRILTEKNFVLYDATQLERLPDGTLGWFYPVYVNKALDFVLPKAFWSEERNNAVIQLQVERRTAILKWNAEFLAHFQNPLPPPQHSDKSPQPVGQVTGRNRPCPCGSGRRFKHCCGANH
jgi:FkbM family methyltransferase